MQTTLLCKTNNETSAFASTKLDTHDQALCSLGGPNFSALLHKVWTTTCVNQLTILVYFLWKVPETCIPYFPDFTCLKLKFYAVHTIYRCRLYKNVVFEVNYDVTWRILWIKEYVNNNLCMIQAFLWAKKAAICQGVLCTRRFLCRLSTRCLVDYQTIKAKTYFWPQIFPWTIVWKIWYYLRYIESLGLF